MIVFDMRFSHTPKKGKYHMAHSPDFISNLRGSETESIWTEVYRKAFPTYLLSVASTEKSQFDRYILLRNGRSLKIKEQVRRTGWADVQLEYLSDRDQRVPGWVCRDSLCDYLAYVFAATRRALVLPFQQLRTAWDMFGDNWIRNGELNLNGFRICESITNRSASVAVPTRVLLGAISQVSVITWDGGDE